MIVRCPSCSTGFHLSAGPSVGAVLRCSRCLVAFPCPAHRRTYALGPPSRTSPPAAPRREPLVPPKSMEEILFAHPPEAAEPAAEEAAVALPPRLSRTRRARWEVEPEVTARTARLLPLFLATLGAGGAWLAERPLGAWSRTLPFPVETWMLAAAGAAAGLLLGVAWLGWRAARR